MKYLNVYKKYIEIFHNNTCILIISFTIPLVPQHLVYERDCFFSWICFIFNPSKIPSTILLVRKERQKEKTHQKRKLSYDVSQTVSCEFPAGMGATPHISFCPSFLYKAKFFFCTSKGVIYRRAYNEYSNRHAPDYIFKNGIATRYGGNIKDLTRDSPRFHPESRDPCVEGRGGGGRAKESHIIESLHLLFDLIYYFLSLAMYLNCFLMGLPSMSTKRKVLVAEVERPRHLVGFHRPGAFHTLFRLGALILSTDFLTASRRPKRAE